MGIRVGLERVLRLVFFICLEQWDRMGCKEGILRLFYETVHGGEMRGFWRGLVSGVGWG
jgi:hypothetical protein